ncbi:polyprenyl synthetase family protein [Actinocorallia sp. A-T 12471]|uniref:polyprenyl synthetase family protein n=1 Tax=Actinocorallia sp. A-T 12471 TaxID=3089813 RepID=UPI0029D22135|nr:polyprenyl synthetase family protein [Actinocorallia sp. A-T 12471]MDX6743656.1 polyprenyl synthetase family protein [Actinocorallia sp. A-T 12471]
MTAVHEAEKAAEVLARGRTLVEPALREAVGSLPDPVRKITGYHMGWWDHEGVPTPSSSGKALRPTLAVLAAEAVGGRAEDAVPAAVAVELVHNFSLLHDDVMDGDLLRRHRPTAWHLFGNGPAVLTGDVLLALAIELVASSGLPARMLTSAVLDLLDGQNSDLTFETRDDVTLSECVAMAVNKTGSLVRCACALGATAGGGTSEQVASFGLFGEHLGLAFQYMDDLLGIWGDPAMTGKPAHSDVLNRKKSLPVVAALTAGTPAAAALAAAYHSPDPQDPADLARLVEAAGGRAWTLERLTQLRNQATATLTALSPSPTPTSSLIALTHLVTDRTH